MIYNPVHLPKLDATIAVCTFGGPEWPQLAERVALPSAESFGVPVVHVHAATLHDARNGALDRVQTEWVVYLDADDELEPGFLDWMADGTADLRAPSVRYVRAGIDRHAYVPQVSGHTHACTGECLPFGNWLVIGSAVRPDTIRRAGGWREWPCYEDWDLWLRCWQQGATVEAVPRSIYRAHVRPESRNRAGDPLDRLEVHRAIARDLGVPVP